MSPDTEPLEYINSVVLFALWLDFFCCWRYCSLCQKFRILIAGILDCYEGLVSKAFGLSWGIKLSLFIVVDNSVSPRMLPELTLKFERKSFKFLHHLILKSKFKNMWHPACFGELIRERALAKNLKAFSFLVRAWWANDFPKYSLLICWNVHILTPSFGWLSWIYNLLTC